MPPAVIFDIDGTLVDTNYQHALSWYRAFRQRGVIMPIWRIHRAIGIGSDRVVEMLAGEQVEQELGEQLRDARDLIDGYTTSADVEQTKPEPDIVHAAVEKAGGGSAVMIGDSTWDCEAATRRASRRPPTCQLDHSQSLGPVRKLLTGR